ncbi:MAG: DnaJ domain-containing protein [Rubrobacter sp.]|nr:DnaJ domain-containing protein [Rubrobacter sp.]
MRDPYKLLGVSENASEDEIRRSYRKLVRRHHPDLNPDDPRAEERFKELQQAYETLTKPGRRGGFDRASRQHASGPRPKPAGHQAAARAEFSGNLSDLLEKLGYRPKTRAGGGAGHLREMREEDVARILRRFGIDAARASKIKVSFGDSADWDRRSPGEDKNRSQRPPINEDLKRPPKPPKPPKW